MIQNGRKKIHKEYYHITTFQIMNIFRPFIIILTLTSCWQARTKLLNWMTFYDTKAPEPFVNAELNCYPHSWSITWAVAWFSHIVHTKSSSAFSSPIVIVFTSYVILSWLSHRKQSSYPHIILYLDLEKNNNDIS